jgi:amino-acid N-acetyltransferase
MTTSPFTVRRARTTDVPRILDLVQPLVDERILLGKEAVAIYEAVQEFRVAEDAMGNIIGCGALHVFWQDLGEVRTLAASRDWLGQGVGHAIMERLIADAQELGLGRLFCLTFEVDFFARHGFAEVTDQLIDDEVYAAIALSHDEGVAEFLDLARVKPNTLGNTRMLRYL